MASASGRIEANSILSRQSFKLLFRGRYSGETASISSRLANAWSCPAKHSYDAAPLWSAELRGNSQIEFFRPNFSVDQVPVGKQCGLLSRRQPLLSKARPNRFDRTDDAVAKRRLCRIYGPRAKTIRLQP